MTIQREIEMRTAPSIFEGAIYINEKENYE
jgi:hypothetical protein